LTVAFAPVKGDRPDWAVQKLTEIGVDRVVFLQAERGVVRWDEGRKAANMERYHRVARAAVMQSRSRWLPELGTADFGWFVARHGRDGAVAMATPGATERPSLDHPTVLVGPEGGWSPGEEAAGLAKVGLGPGVLRSETAAVVAGALLCALRSGLVRQA
jgi:16S rRNA (uracil1498-N3)-methyltransferase